MNLFFLITYEYFVGSESGCFEKSDPVKKKPARIRNTGCSMSSILIRIRLKINPLFNDIIFIFSDQNHPGQSSSGLLVEGTTLGGGHGVQSQLKDLDPSPGPGHAQAMGPIGLPDLQQGLNDYCTSSRMTIQA